MGNCKFTLQDTATIQGVVRRKMEKDGPTVMQAYELAVAELNAQAPAGHQAGYYIDAKNEPKRIKGSIPSEHCGGVKDKIAKPLSVTTVNAVDDEEDSESEPIHLPPPTMSDVQDMELLGEAAGLSAPLDDENEDDVTRVEQATDEAATDDEDEEDTDAFDDED
jgi:hypothetical protein